jgi:hypothetical protein
MKRFQWGLALIAIMAASGCNQGTSGGPGATNTPSNTSSTTASKPELGQAEDTFSLSLPTLATHIKQGETRSVTIGITRGKNFDQDVSLKFTDIPKGVTMTPPNPTIKHGEKETKVDVIAATDAALGDFSVNVTGHPATGADAKSKLSLKVNEK